MKWYCVAAPIDTTKPFIKKVKAGGKELCLVGVADELFALSARCPHAGGDLSQGWCENGKLICPLHRYAYDLTTGKGSPGQNDYVDNYPVEVRDDGIYIGMATSWEKFVKAFK